VWYQRRAKSGAVYAVGNSVKKDVILALAPVKCLSTAFSGRQYTASERQSSW
jgi:hypothetical protein